MTGAVKVVDVEVPRPWLESVWDGERNRQMFAALQSGLSLRGLDARYADIPFGTSFAPKVAPAGGFRISYHSCGDARHVWRLKETPIPYFYSFDRLGFSGWSEPAVRREVMREAMQAVDASHARADCERITAWLDRERLSKYRQADDGLVPDEPFVFFPLQVRRDIVAHFARIDPLAALREAAREARRRRVLLVVKRHPFCTSRLVALAMRAAAAGNPYVVCSTAPVNRLLAGCGSVLLSNSGVGVEALLRGRLVYAFGRSEYDSAVVPVHRRADVGGAFEFGNRSTVDTGYRFAHLFLRELCLDCRDPESVARQLRFAEYCAARDAWCEHDRFGLWRSAGEGG